MTRRSRVAREKYFGCILKMAKRPKFSDFSQTIFFFGMIEFWNSSLSWQHRERTLPMVDSMIYWLSLKWLSLKWLRRKLEFEKSLGSVCEPSRRILWVWRTSTGGQWKASRWKNQIWGKCTKSTELKCQTNLIYQNMKFLNICTLYAI